MRFIDRSTIGVVVTIWAVFAQAGVAVCDDPPRPTTKESAPIYVFVETPSDLDAIKNRLNRPDFVILKGSLYDQLKKLERATNVVEPVRGVVESVAIEGEVFGDVAHLSAEFGIVLTGAEPVWVPIRLQGLVPREARENDRVLLLKSVEGGWFVEVRGEGVHKVRVDLIANVFSVKGSLDSKKLECTIPEAPSTRVQLILGPRVDDAAILGGIPAREPLAIEPIEAGQRNRVTASLTPRRKIELTWRFTPESTPSGPPPVTAQGDIALEVERGSIRARSTWDVRVERGSLQRLELRVDPADELLSLEWDGKPVGGSETRDASSGIMAITLPEPLRPNIAGKLAVSTRRSIPAEASARATYRGVPILGVAAQSGNLAIIQRGSDSWISPTPGPGAHQIDPRSLPESLRNRGSIILAYQFSEQPFEFGLQIDPAPPWIRVDSRTTVTIERARAKVDTWLDYTVSQGRVLEVLVGVPEAIAMDAPVGPETAVAAWEKLAVAPEGSNAVVARLTRKASEDGVFSIHLSGWQPISPGKPANLAMFRPLGAHSRGGSIAVLAARGISVEMNAAAASAGEFSSAGLEPPASWMWPSGRAAASPTALWLRHDEASPVLPLAITVHDRAVSEESTIDARVDRQGIDILQETNVRVQFGSLTRVDVAIPPGLEISWSSDDKVISQHERLGVGPDGWVRFRLTPYREITESVRLVFAGRVAIEPGLVADAPKRLEIPRVRILDASSGPSKIRVGGDTSIELAPEGAGWIAESGDVRPRSESAFAASWSRVGTEPAKAVILATARARAVLPASVASRLAIRTTMDADGALRSVARFGVDSGAASFVVALPEGAEWIRARVGRDEVKAVDRLTEPVAAYRLKLPADLSGPVVVSLEYVVPPRHVGSTWAAPRLLENAVVQETLWEIRVPTQWAVAGVPDGWGDENRWRWNTYAFMREPQISPDALELWIAGAKSRSAAESEFVRSASHAYLFSRIGPINGIRPWIVHRAWLVGIFSSASLGMRLLLLFSRPRRRALGIAGLIACVAVSALIPPNLIVLIAQSSVLGAVLALVAIVTQGFVDRRAPHSPLFPEPSGVGGSVPSILGHAVANEVGSDVSTIVRARTGTTIDHAAAVAKAEKGEGP